MRIIFLTLLLSACVVQEEPQKPKTAEEIQAENNAAIIQSIANTISTGVFWGNVK